MLSCVQSLLAVREGLSERRRFSCAGLGNRARGGRAVFPWRMNDTMREAGLRLRAGWKGALPRRGACSVEEPSARRQLLCGCCPPPPPGCCRLTAVLCDLAVRGFFGFLGAAFKPSGRPREQWRATAGLLRSHGLWGCEFRNVDENRGAGEP